MSTLIAAVGRSGTGKSTSLFRNDALGIIGLPPENTVIINPSKKDLPFKGSRKVYPPGTKYGEGARDLRIDNPKTIANFIAAVDKNENGKLSSVKYIVVDDAQYLQSYTFMDNIKVEGWDKFNDAGNAAYLPLRAAEQASRSDLTIIFLYHMETDEGEEKIKTVGKMVDKYVTIEGFFTIVLYTKVVHDPSDMTNAHYFVTQNNGKNTGKSPIGMFEERLIPNDMGYVVKKAKEYYEES